MNFNNFQTTVSNAVTTVTKAFDFSQWEDEQTAPADVISDLGLTGDEIVMIQSNQFGLSEKLKSSFRFLTARNGKLKTVLRASIVFESRGRECSYEELAEGLGCTCNTAYQNGLKLREAYENAFGLHLTSTADGIHLASIDEAQIQNERVLKNFEEHILPSLNKFGRQLRSLQQTNSQYSLTARTQALLQAALTEEN